MEIYISARTLEKLTSKHSVTPQEIEECFQNRSGVFLIDDREDHQSDPPTQWFIAPTDLGRALKVCFVRRGKEVHIKSAYQPEPEAVRIYEEYHR